MPTSTDLVTDLPADFEVFGQAVDTQMKTNADAATQKATLTTKGDIYAATGTSTPARLAVGANDTVLTADSTAATGLKWAAVAGGGMTVIASGSLSGSAVNLTSIPGTYKNLQLVIRDFSSLHDGDNLRFRFNNDSTNNRYLVKQTSDGSAATAFNENRGVASANQDDSVRDGLIVLDVYDYANSSTWKLSQAQAVTNDNTTTTSARHWNASIYYNQTAAITEINLVALIADFNNGTYILYGVN
jgi:hypothetical protein